MSLITCNFNIVWEAVWIGLFVVAAVVAVALSESQLGSWLRQDSAEQSVKLAVPVACFFAGAVVCIDPLIKSLLSPFSIPKRKEKMSVYLWNKMKNPAIVIAGF